MLTHEPTLRGFAQKLPSAEAKKAYIALRIKMMQECEDATPPTVLSELEVVEKFMKAERRRQELFEGLIDEKEVKPREPKILDWRDNNCFQCGKSGHKKADCPGLGGGRSYANYQASPNPCPACDQQHTYTNIEGNVVPCTRLGASCPVFSSMDVCERVAIFEKVNGCAGCLDFTGRHQREQCWARQSNGQPFTCSEMVNGARCNKNHHYMLHGSSSKFSCHVQLNRVCASVASTVQEEMARAEAEYLEELEEEEWADLEIPGLALYVKKLAEAEQNKVKDNTMDQRDEVKKEQGIMLHITKAEAVQIENNKQAAFQEVEVAEKEDSFSHEPGTWAEEVVMSSKVMLDVMKVEFEEEEYSVADLKIDKEVDGLDFKAKEVDVMKLKEKEQSVVDLMIDKKGEEVVVNLKDKEEKLYVEEEAEAKLIHTEKAEAVEDVRKPRLSKRESGNKIDKRMEEKVTRDEKERQKLSPLEADKRLPPDQEVVSRTEVSSLTKK